MKRYSEKQVSEELSEALKNQDLSC